MLGPAMTKTIMSSLTTPLATATVGVTIAWGTLPLGAMVCHHLYITKGMFLGGYMAPYDKENQTKSGEPAYHLHRH